MNTTYTWICAILVFLSWCPSGLNAEESLDLYGSIKVNNRDVVITIENAMQKSILITDFWQCFSKGKFIKKGVK